MGGPKRSVASVGDEAGLLTQTGRLRSPPDPLLVWRRSPRPHDRIPGKLMTGACAAPRFTGGASTHPIGGVPVRIMSTWFHGILDYLVGVALMAAPWVLGFPDLGVATWLPVILGGGAILYSFMTD